MSATFISYCVYLIISIGMTVWVARTLFKNGRIFLVEAFQGRENIADSVNHLLVVGFYLMNLGFVSLYLKGGMDVASAAEAMESLSTKVGVVMLVLGGMHFFNILVFSRWRNRERLHRVPPPVSPSGQLGYAGAGAAPIPPTSGG